MAINKLISIKTPVLEALQDMGIDHGKNITDLTRWAARAEQIIGSYYSFRKTIKVLTVDKCRIELPCEAGFVQRIILGDFGCKCFDLFDYICGISPSLNVATDNTFLVIDRPEGGWNCVVSSMRWEVQDNHIVLNGDYDKQKVTVQYLGLPYDSEDFPLVMENHLEAIVEFIMYRFAKRSRFSPVKMDLGDVQMLKQSWEKLAASARADDAEIPESDRNDIVNMIHDPFVGIGMQILYNRTYLGGW